MATYIILSRISSDAFTDPSEFKNVAKKVASKIKSECKDVRWKDSYAVTGRFDVVDIVESNNLASVEKAAMIIRGYGKSETETMVATPWSDFLKSI